MQAASSVQSSTARLADANSKQLHSLRTQLLQDISELLPEATSDPMPVLRRLDRRLQVGACCEPLVFEDSLTA